MRETAYAKINLALHVRERMADGYHRIETVFAFCEAGDEIEAAPAAEDRLETDGPMAGALDGPNLIEAAAAAMREEAGRQKGQAPPHAAIRLTKNLPVAAGLGGGSADAAATIRLLDRMWDTKLSRAAMEAIAREIGADVPACVHARTMRGEGRGDALTPIDDPELAGKPVLLVNPGVKLSTADVFARWDGRDRGALNDWRDGRNDLQDAATAIIPEIGGAIALMADAETARMSGSGATCFALYPSDEARDAAAQRIAARRPGWWVCATRLRG